VIDSLISGHLAAVHPDVEFVNADIRDEEALTRLFATHNFDAVINYGGYIQAGESVTHPGRYFANNISGAITLINTMLTYDVSRLVFSSSAAVYGEPAVIPITEDQPINPVNPYGETKAAVERLLPWYERANDLRWVALRYFNAAGAGERRGEDHRPETHLIPIVLQVALGQRQSVPLYGQNYPTRDGTCIRDYVHVSDLATAHLLALATRRPRRLQHRKRYRLLNRRYRGCAVTEHEIRWWKSRAGPAIRRPSSRRAKRRNANSDGRPLTRKSKTSSPQPGSGTVTTPTATPLSHPNCCAVPNNP
jgi:UDP-glucose-4-epimerase GalE